MPTPGSPQSPGLASGDWNATAEEIARELRDFIVEFGSFNPDWFVDVKFHLLRTLAFSRQARDELCSLAIDGGLCMDCDLRYAAKKCLLWYRLFKDISWSIVRRAPPCIRIAFVKRRIKWVADYLVAAGVIDLPFYTGAHAPSCKSMQRWGYCSPDRYCSAMTRQNTLSYVPARDRVKMTR